MNSFFDSREFLSRKTVVLRDSVSAYHPTWFFNGFRNVSLTQDIDMVAKTSNRPINFGYFGLTVSVPGLIS